MSSDAADLFRCPIDPARDSLLTRDRDKLRCDRCGVCFPVKNGLPILLSDEAELPAGLSARRELPCQRR